MYIIEKFLQQEIFVIGAYYAHKLIRSDKNIVVDLIKFEMGEMPILLICGVAGSGKTTLGKEYAVREKCLYVSLDDIWDQIIDDQNIDMDNIKQENIEAIHKEVIQFALKKIGPKKAVIEGIQIVLGPKLFVEQILNDCAVVFLGTSLIISGIRKIISHKYRSDSLKSMLNTIFIKNRKWNKLLQYYRIKRASVGPSEVEEIEVLYK